MTETLGKELASFRVPLTPYDVLGYLVPGGIFFILVYLFELWGRTQESGSIDQARLHTPVWTGFQVLRPAKEDWVTSVFFIVSMLVPFYVAGHIIASLSSLVIDRVLVAKGHGYPYVRLLALPEDPYRATYLGPQFYRGIFVWFNVYLLLRYVQSFLAGPKHAIVAAGWLGLAARILAWWLVAGLLLKLLVGWLVEGRGGLKSALWLRKIPRRGVKRALRWIPHFLLGRLWPIPYDLVASTLSKYIFTREPFDGAFREHYRKAFRERFSLEPDQSGTNNFWLPYIHLRSSAPELSFSLLDWLRLYSFARNLSAAFYLVFVYGYGWLVLNQARVSDWASYRVEILIVGPACCLLLAMIMLIRYYYLYVAYFTKFVFRAFVYLEGTVGEEQGESPAART